MHPVSTHCKNRQSTHRNQTYIGTQQEIGCDKGADLFLGRRQHEVVLGVGQADHHALHSVLTPPGQHTEEVNAKGTR